MRVYDLRSGPVRLDSSAAAVYHDTEGNTLFGYGHIKDHRPDLPQFKVMLATAVRTYRKPRPLSETSDA